MPDTSTAEAQSVGNPLAKRFTPLSLFRFAFPTIFMMVFMGLYTTVDTIFVSRFVNTNALSSINIVTPVINLIVGLGAMLATGGSAIIARKLGDAREADARNDLTQITLLGLGIGVLIAIIGLANIRPIVIALGASEALLPYTLDYLSVLLFFAPANIVQVLFSVFFIAAGRPGLGMAASIAGGLANVALDYVFIVVMHMGIAGAALATGIGYAIPALVGLAFFLRNRSGALFFTKPHFTVRVLLESCYNGSSEMVSQLSAAITTFYFNRAMLALLGEDGVAAITIIIYSQFLLVTLYIGYSMGVAPIISYNYGNGNQAQLRRIRRMCFTFITALSLVTFGLALWKGSWLVQLFSPGGTAVYNITRGGFAIFQYSFLFCGFTIFASALFTALSNGLLSAVISFSRTFVFLIAGIHILPIFLGVNGIWLTIPLSELLAFGLSVVLISMSRKRYKY